MTEAISRLLSDNLGPTATIPDNLVALAAAFKPQRACSASAHLTTSDHGVEAQSVSKQSLVSFPALPRSRSPSLGVGFIPVRQKYGRQYIDV